MKRKPVLLGDKHRTSSAAGGRAAGSMSYDSVVGVLLAALSERDAPTGAHSCRVAPIALRVAREAGWTPGSRDWRALENASCLHDLGKIGVRDAILYKPGPLSSEEWTEMRRHPDAAHRVLQDIEFLRTAAEIVRSHHERWDGRGYPRGLRGKEIVGGARILALADAFDAMTSDRPYRRALPLDRALAEIGAHRGTQFEPRLVDAFESCFDDLVAYVEGGAHRPEADAA